MPDTELLLAWHSARPNILAQVIYEADWGGNGFATWIQLADVAKIRYRSTARSLLADQRITILKGED